MTARPIDSTTVISLLSTLSLLALAFLASLRLLPTHTSPQHRTLYVWHLFDALIHFLFEGSFLYHCFFAYTVVSQPTTSDSPDSASLASRRGVQYFLGRSDRRYGNNHGTSPLAVLWQEYAKADSRWGEADLTVISIELLTVFVAGPLAAYICFLLQHQNIPSPQRSANDNKARLWFSAIVLATGELYGGFMTFSPEWLSGSPSLDTGNWMYMWVYLVFFNGLWVVVPGWVLRVAYREMKEAFAPERRKVR